MTRPNLIFGVLSFSMLMVANHYEATWYAIGFVWAMAFVALTQGGGR